MKEYIARTYGDPEKYNEECATLNRLRQDMRGAGKDSAAGRDLLYRYYGQLELLDLRFPVEERGVRVAFTWWVVLRCAVSLRETVVVVAKGGGETGLSAWGLRC